MPYVKMSIMESLEKTIPTYIKIVAILKKALFAGEYKSGDELSLTDIATKLGVSRTPVREAFQTLASEDLIELRMNKGAIVKPIDEKFIREHYEMRILLEAEASYRAAKNGMDTSVLLSRLYDAKDNIDALSSLEYEKLNLDIHTSIWMAADNRKLYSYLTNLWNGPSTGYANSEKEHYRISTQEHIKILESISKGDGENAKKEMAIHISRSMDNILKSFKIMQSLEYRNDAIDK